MARTTCIALLLAVPAVAVAGCGGKDDSTSKTSAARGASGQQGTTGPQTGASGGTGTRDARPKRTGKSKHRSPKKRGADRGNAGSAAPATPTPPPSSTPGSSLTPEQLKQVKPGMYKQARFLCKASTLQGLAQRYGIKSGKADDLARAYAAPYPVGLRKTVTAGCKAGLLESK